MQEARKNAGLEVSDRITVWVTSTDAELSDALGKHAEEIAREVLAVELHQEAPVGVTLVDVAEGTEEDLQLSYWLVKA